MLRRVLYGVVGILLLVVLLGRALTAQGPAPIGTVHLQGGWATFGQAVPQGLAPSGQSLRIGSEPTQTDVKNRWPDGSIKFAVLTAQDAVRKRLRHYRRACAGAAALTSSLFRATFQWRCRSAARRILPWRQRRALAPTTG